jgi:hypothetical protein
MIPTKPGIPPATVEILDGSSAFFKVKSPGARFFGKHELFMIES